MKTFELPALSYAYNAMEPFIDAKTMEIHHLRHHQAYVDNLNKAIAGIERSDELSLADLMKGISNLPVTIRNNGGGHYNHSFFWKQLIAPIAAEYPPEQQAELNEQHSKFWKQLIAPIPGKYSQEQLAELTKQYVGEPIPALKYTPATKPQPKLLAAIESAFGSLEAFKEKFAEAAAGRFGSGWVWLIVSADDNKLTITSTANQDNPLMVLPEIITGSPVIALDVWEHAYYLKYQNKRPSYVTAFWNVLDWAKAEQNYLAAL